MKQGFPVSLFVPCSYGHQVYFTSSNEDPDYGFIMETKVLKDTEEGGGGLRKSYLSINQSKRD